MRAIPAATTTTALAAVVVIAGCAAGPLTPSHTGTPMNRPVAISPDPGSGSVESLRRQLAGDWNLVALETVPPGGGPRVPVAATGTLTYDDFGNLTIEARTTDPAAPVAAREVSQVSFEGRAVIDPVRSELKLMDLTGNVNPDEVLSPERRRRFAFDGDTLVLSSFDTDGQVTAISTWRRP